MKHVLAFILIFAIVAMANGFYVLGGLVVFLIAIIFSFALKKGSKIVDLYFGMPTVWQNIQETVELGLKFGLLDNVTTLHCIREFYGQMETQDDLFEIKINEQLVRSFELEYSKPPEIQNISTVGKVLYYFTSSVKFNPERLPKILGAIQVRKKVGGKKQDPEKEVSDELRPIYA